MDTKQFFKDVYEDFFGVEKIKAENEKLAKELGLNQDYPTIELNKQDEAKEELTEEQIKETKDEFMLKAFEKLEKLYITEQSKNTLKKIIEYMRKYSEGIEKQYIPFNICIYSNNKETMYSIVDIISDTVTFFSYIKRGTTIETSFYNIEKPEQIEEIYSKKNSVVVLKDFEGILAKEKEFKDRFLHNMKEKLEENQEDFLTILISKTPETIEQAMQSDMLEKYFEFKIESTNIDVQDVYQEVLSKLKESSKITDEASIKLLDYIAATYPKTNLSFPEYRDKLCNKILFSKDHEITEKALKDSRFAKWFHQQMGYVFQNADTQLFCGSVEEEIAFGPTQMGLSEGEIKQRTDDCLKLFGIEKLRERPPYHLSGGEKRKVSLACILSMNPEVLILDEPLAGLDESTQKMLIDFLKKFHAAGKTLIIITHNNQLAKELGTRFIKMNEDHELAI